MLMVILSVMILQMLHMFYSRSSVFGAQLRQNRTTQTDVTDNRFNTYCYNEYHIKSSQTEAKAKGCTFCL